MMKKMYIKQPSHSWTFYPAHPQILHEMILDFIVNIESNIDLKEILNEAVQKRLWIAPHAGYIYSWIVAAWTYRILQTNPNIRKLIVIWPAHYVEANGWILSNFDWFQSPLGILKIDKDIQNYLVSQNPKIFTVSDEAHIPEHSIEVQIPFIQSTLKIESFVPILGWIDADWKSMWEILATVCQENPEIWLIISSDLSHYLPYEIAVNVDTETIETIINWEAEKIVWERACWYQGIRSYIVATEILEIPRIPVIYANSGDTAGDKSRVVWYLSMIS